MRWEHGQAGDVANRMQKPLISNYSVEHSELQFSLSMNQL